MHNIPQRFTAHKFADLTRTGFFTSDYSALKFGSDRSAKLFGYEMGDKFFAQYRDLLIQNRCVIIPAAFKVIEIAASILAKHFMNRLNYLLVSEGYPRVDYLTMQRSMNYTVDYSTMPKEERERLLTGDRFSINREFIKDKVLVFVDDVFITGTHEKKLLSFIEEEGIENQAIFCYFTTYTGEIADIEYRLNFSGVKTVQDYVKLVQEPNHHLVVRAVRFLLDKGVNDLRYALDHLGADFLERFYLSCLAQDYHTSPKYSEAFAVVQARYNVLMQVDEAIPA